MAGGEQYQGISVPEGSASELEHMSSGFAGMAGSFEGAAMRLHGMPSQVSGWHGPGSVAFAASAHRQGDACHRAAVAFAHARDAARHFAHELRDAQRRARHAIEHARDAQRRLDEAHDEIVDAQRRIDAAQAQAQAAAKAPARPALTRV